jgi:uncharacterized protein YjbI with pentapeptide repeats
MQDDRGLLSRYAAGERNFSSNDLSGINLYGSPGKEIDLSEADFSSANLEDAILSHVKLDNTNFSDANLRNAQLSGKINDANFSRANLINSRIGASQINRVKFIGADLTNADFGANLSGHTSLDFREADCTNTKLTCNLREADFQGANIKHAIFHLQNLHWYRANLSRANLSGLDLSGQDFLSLEMNGVNLSGSNLADANLRSVNLEGADLRGANLKGADLTFANLRNTNIETVIELDPKILRIWQIINQGTKDQHLTGSDLSRANFKAIDFSGLDLNGVNFQGANLCTANFSHADLSGANLQNALLSQANLEKANLSQSQLIGANLAGANLTQANLSQANLLGANLAGAKLQNSILRDANLTDAILGGADLIGANLSNADLTGTELYRVTTLTPSPNNPNQELLSQLREACTDLTYGSESNYPYEVFLWETDSLGDFNLEELLKIFGSIRELSSDEFCSENLDNLEWLMPIADNASLLKKNKEVIQAFRTLLAPLEGYLTNIQILRLAVPEQNFYIVLGNTPSGDWFGMSTQASSSLEQQHYSSQVFRVKDLAVAKSDNQELILVVENAIAGVRFSSEYLDCFVWEIAEQRSALIHNLLDTVRITTTNEVKCIFGFEEDEDDSESSEGQANRLVMENLSSLRLYRLNEGEIDLYFVGQTKNGDWIGFRTKAIET